MAWIVETGGAGYNRPFGADGNGLYTSAYAHYCHRRAFVCRNAPAEGSGMTRKK